MAENTKIGWTDHSFSPWRGCQKLSPACTNCYADAMSKRNPKTLGVFGTEAQGGTRVVAAEDYWKQPLKWNRLAKVWALHVEYCKLTGILDPVGEWARRDNGNPPAMPRRPRVFSASIADVFEDWQGAMMNHKGEQLYWSHSREPHESVFHWVAESNCAGGETPVTMDAVRERLFELIDQTTNLDYLLLTKRPENIRKKWIGWVSEFGNPHAARTSRPEYRKNVWLGTTVENQECANERLLGLLECSDMVPVLFLSMEPLLGPVDLEWPEAINPARMCCSGFECGCQGLPCDPPLVSFLQWVIVGCESGPNRRETKLEWVRDLRDQCKRWHVPFFVKQLEIDGKVTTDVSQFPEDLRIQEFPEC